MNRNYLNNGIRQGYRAAPIHAAPVMSGGTCGKPQPGPGKSLAMAYVPSQPFEGLYPAAEALRHGTLFTALDLPYCAGGGR